MDTRQDLTATMSRPYTRFTVQPQGKHVLRTQNHTSSSYNGLMFTVRAGKEPIRITKLHAASGGNPRKELYRVYLKHGHFLDGVMDPSKWREMTSGETELPVSQNTYGELPWPYEGVKVQATITSGNVAALVFAEMELNGAEVTYPQKVKNGEIGRASCRERV